MRSDATRRAEDLPPPDPERLRTGAAALFLDLEAAFAAVRCRPDRLGADPMGAEALGATRLRRLGERLGGRLAILSGGPLKDIDLRLDGSVTAAAGGDGAERRRADGVVDRRLAGSLAPEALRAGPASASDRPGLMAAPKSLAAPASPAALAEAAKGFALDLGADLRQTAQTGARIAGVRRPGPDKGVALLAFMTEDPFNGARPVMIGDDLADEPAFAVAAGLGGFGVLVGPPRLTSALFRLEDGAALAAFIDRVLAPLGARAQQRRSQVSCPA